jgi:hypothetical protein
MQANVGCPFYQYDDGRRLVCEGVFDESVLVSLFRNKSSCQSQMRIFCCDHFDKCEIYRMLMALKYEEEDL